MFEQLRQKARLAPPRWWDNHGLQLNYADVETRIAREGGMEGVDRAPDCYNKYYLTKSSVFRDIHPHYLYTYTGMAVHLPLSMPCILV